MMKGNFSPASNGSRTARVTALSIVRPETAPLRRTAGPMMSKSLDTGCDPFQQTVGGHPDLQKRIAGLACACSHGRDPVTFAVHTFLICSPEFAHFIMIACEKRTCVIAIAVSPV